LTFFEGKKHEDGKRATYIHENNNIYVFVRAIKIIIKVMITSLFYNSCSFITNLANKKRVLLE